MKTCVIVLGMHRSGTSAFAGLLRGLGLDLGTDLLGPAPENPKGFFENKRITEFNNDILVENGSGYDDTGYDFPIDKVRFSDYVEKALTIINEEFAFSKIFAIKDPRMCLTFPIWKEALGRFGAKIVVLLPYRNPLEVARSLNKRDKFSVQKSILLWSKYFLLAERYSRPFKRRFFSFSELVSEESLISQQIADFLELDGTVSLERGFVDARLKHQNIAYSNVDARVPLHVQFLMNLMEEHKLEETSPEVFDQLREELIGLHEIMYASDVLSDAAPVRQIVKENTNAQSDLIMLKRIVGLTTVDPDYYLNKYRDVSECGADPVQHFLEFGRGEGRFPNEYCETHQIADSETTSDQEKVFDAKQRLRRLSVELERCGASVVDQQSKQNESLRAAHTSERTFQETIAQQQQRLEQENQEKAVLRAKYVALQPKLANLQGRIRRLGIFAVHAQDSCDLLFGPKVDLLEEEYERLESLLSGLNEENAVLLVRQQELKDELRGLGAEFEIQAKRIVELEQACDTTEFHRSQLRKENTDLQKEMEEGQQKIAMLTQQIDAVVRDLARIKESRCWIYTKPIRELGKFLQS